MPCFQVFSFPQVLHLPVSQEPQVASHRVKERPIKSFKRTIWTTPKGISSPSAWNGPPPAARALGPQVSHTTGFFNAHFIVHFSDKIWVSQVSLMDWDVVAVKLSTSMSSMIWMTCRIQNDVLPAVERRDLAKELPICGCNQSYVRNSHARWTTRVIPQICTWSLPQKERAIYS